MRIKKPHTLKGVMIQDRHSEGVPGPQAYINGGEGMYHRFPLLAAGLKSFSKGLKSENKKMEKVTLMGVG